MASLILHPATKTQIESFISTPSHALLLYGPAGSGKMALAMQVASKILKVDVSKISSYPYVNIVDAGKISSDGIETVRQLEHFLSLKVPRRGINRIVIINNADALSIEAQNALLKTIEEPPAGTVVILTAQNQASILPTIVSRAQSIMLNRPAKNLLINYFEKAGYLPTKVNMAYATSGGLPGLMHALLTDEAHPLFGATVMARQLLQLQLYERLLLVDELTKQRPLVIDTLFIMQQMAHLRLASSENKQFRRWQRILKASYEASEQLEKNAQLKIVLDSLILKLN